MGHIIIPNIWSICDVNAMGL